jgi:membrane protein
VTSAGQPDTHDQDTFDLVKSFLVTAVRTPRETIPHFLGQTIWRWDLSRMPRMQRLGVLILRMVYLIGRAFVSSRAQLQAMALTYTTMLALVPAVAIVVALFSIRGLEEARGRLETFIFSALAASDQTEAILSKQLLELSEALTQSRGIAGVAFLVFLFLTIVSLLSTLEKTLNQIWGVKRSRSFRSKLVTYWCMATIGPLCLGVALAQGSVLEYQLYQWTSWGSSWIQESASEEPTPSPTASPDAPPEHAGVDPLDDFGFGGFGGAVVSELESQQRVHDEDLDMEWVLTGVRRPADQGFSFLGFALTSLTFTLIYVFMPNTKVRVIPALAGGVTATALWTGTKWLLAASSTFLVRYDTVYGGLATIPITMVWLFLTWLLVILGAEFTFAIQNVNSQRMEELASETTSLCKEILALRLTVRICQAFEAGAQPPNLEELSGRLGAPQGLCGQVLYHLCEDGILREIERSGDEQGFVPARPLDRLRLYDVIESLRERAGVAFDLTWGEDLPVLSEHLGEANAAFRRFSSEITLRQVVQTLDLREQAKTAHPNPELAAVSAVAAQAIASASLKRSRELRRPDQREEPETKQARLEQPPPEEPQPEEPQPDAAPPT